MSQQVGLPFLPLTVLKRLSLTATGPSLGGGGGVGGVTPPENMLSVKIMDLSANCFRCQQNLNWIRRKRTTIN